MKLHTLLQSHPLVDIPTENPEITGIKNDNRLVQPGDLFICISGLTVDGHDFAESAVENGAVAVVAEKDLNLPVPVIKVKDTKKSQAVLADAFFDHPTQKLHLIGVTGTNGKTTTTQIIQSIFNDYEKVTGLIGTLSITVDDQVIETKNTTPDSIVLQSTFQEMVNKKVDVGIMEVSSHALVQRRVDGCDFDVAIFTNLSQDHLDYHKTMDEYCQAKSLLFSRLGNTYIERKPKFAILNADDPVSEQFASVTAAHIVTYGIEKQADFMASDIVLEHTGTSFNLHTPEGKRRVKLKLAGKFNVYNTLASITAAYVSQIPLSIIIQSIENTAGVPGRFELVDGGQDFSVIVDYAHTPDGLENVLKTIKQFARKKIYCVVGCGGDRDPQKRPVMAKIACDYATNPIFTSDNPRTEDPVAIVADMEKGVQGRQYETIVDRKEAIRKAIQAAEKDDVVLIAGKGHETYQIIGNEVLDFDDRLVALEAIQQR